MRREHVYFAGKKYYKTASGHWRCTDRKGKYLHVEIWEATNGKVPEGCEIHHIDLNPQNNALDNLKCMTKSAHRSLHSTLRSERPANYNKPKFCLECGKEFMAARKDRCFCSQPCKSKWEYEHGYGRKRKTCLVCGVEFITTSSSQKYCSQKCAAHLLSKLTDIQRAEIKRRYKAGGVSQRQLAEEYNVDQKTVYNIIHSR